MAAVRLARTAAAEHRMTWRQRHGDLAENL
jgi:hypothetical protein